MPEPESKSSPAHAPKNKAKASTESVAKEETAKSAPTVAEPASQPNGAYDRFLVLLRAKKVGDNSETDAVQEEAAKLIGNKLIGPDWKSANWLPDGQTRYLRNLRVLVLSLARKQIGLVGKFRANKRITQLVVPERTMKVHVS